VLASTTCPPPPFRSFVATSTQPLDSHCGAQNLRSCLRRETGRAEEIEKENGGALACRTPRVAEET
jgi:hypothetical protein